MKINILYVEDDKIIRDAFKLFFERYHNIIDAENGKDGLEKFNSLENIDLIISDIQMPVMNGLVMVEKIKEINKDIPVYFLTAFDDIEFLDKAKALEINRYIDKPLNVKQIMQFIEEDFA